MKAHKDFVVALRWNGEIVFIDLFAVGPTCELVWSDYERKMVER